MELSERKIRILKAIVDDYIASGIPVGSRTISKLWGGEFSPATIRNEMSDLFEMGYLNQPHTSSGRVPSQKAYRYYVDRMLHVPGVDQREMEQIKRYFTSRMDQIGEIISVTAKTLSASTNYVSIAMAPELRNVLIKQIRLVPVTRGRALVVIVTNMGFVNDLFINIPEDVDDSSLDMISNALTSLMEGKSVAELQKTAQGMMEEMQYHGKVFESLIEVISASENAVPAKSIVFDGAQNLFRYPEFTDVERAKSILTALQTQDTIYDILNRANQLSLSISIGMENGREDLNDVSVVTATYSVDGQQVGSFGVIGPMRMNYPRVVSIMQSLGSFFIDFLHQQEK